MKKQVRVSLGAEYASDLDAVLLQYEKAKQSELEVSVEFNPGGDFESPYYDFYSYREESDEEYQDRLKSEKEIQDQEEQRKLRREQKTYERLKKKYGQTNGTT